MLHSKSIDVLIIGAGPAGAVAGAHLLKTGLTSLVVEKSFFPRFVIGESLLPRCMDNFEEVGLLPFLEKRNYQLKTGAIFKRGEEECVFDFSNQFTDGKTFTWQVPRADFDQTLANGLEELGGEIWFGSSVEKVSIQENYQKTSISKSDGSQVEITSKFIIDASGYGRVLPRLLNLDKSSDLPVRTTIFSHIRDHKNNEYKNYQEYITYLVHDKHYVWNIPLSKDTISVGFVGENEVFDDVDGDISDKYKALISKDDFASERYNHHDYVFEPKVLKGFSVGVKKLYGNGFVLTGNSTEFLDPIFSSGVTLATESALIAAKLVEKQLLGKPVDWEKEFEEEVRFGIDVFKTYVNAWYDKSLETIFFAPNPDEKIKKQICSILAGYVWDRSNPCIAKYKTILKTMEKVLEIQS